MNFLYLLEGIRNPVFNFFFSFITYFGDEIVFLAVSILFFWCVDKKRGYYILITGLIGTLINQTLKLAFKVPRPWVKDPAFTIVENAKEAAAGYSFPSGHTQNVAGTFGAIGATTASSGVRIFSVAMIALVALSRMYLGVHTPLDVVVSLLIAAALLVILYPVFKTDESFKKYMPVVVGVSAALSAAFLAYVLLMPKDGLDPHNVMSGMKNAATLFGCTAGLVVVYTVDSKYVNFRTDAPWYFQIVKIAVGFAGVMLIKSGLSSPLVSLFGNEYVARSVRYFLIVLFSGIVWPLTFRYFATHRIKKLDDMTYKLVKKLSKNNKNAN